MNWDVAAIRAQFPILNREIDGKPLVYLDNAATTQKPQCVIDALTHYYSHFNSNVHRGAHRLADEATREFEGARDRVAQFLNANAREEVIWTSGTTEAINIVTHGVAAYLQAGERVVITEMEHHADLVTWQQVCKQCNAELVIAPINDLGELDIAAFTSCLTPNTRMVAFPQVSNALGTINPIKELISLAKAVGAWVLVDGAQGVAHEPTDVQALGCDFYAFSAHKVFGPTGVGVLWGKKSLLENWPVWQTGGEMISSVTYQNAEWNVLPYRLEAGTPNIAGVIAFGAAIRWLQQQDWDAMRTYETLLMASATEQAQALEGLTIIGQAREKVGVLSFVMDEGHPADVGFLLDKQGIAVRTGHHCAEPLMNRLGIPGTARASFSIYNTLDEIDQLFIALKKVRTMLA